MHSHLRLVALVFALLPSCRALGGEKAFFATPAMAPNVSHRQNVCDRYDLFRSGQVELKDALEGLQLHVVAGDNEDGDYFNYDENKGIDPGYPGLVPVILDELARRGKFTWRDTFGTYGHPDSFNSTWTELLRWTLDTYDLTADWWAHSLERIAFGTGFPEGWLDSSMILIGKLPQSDEDGILLWNWLKPYDTWVWFMTIFTVLLSGIVYQILEWYADERNERSLWEWWLENAYLSTINFTQAYEYQPKTLASRVFGVSMAIWALVMTATYTANLASLLVDKGLQETGPETLEEAVVFGHTFCTWKGTSTDTYLKKTYKSAIRIEKQTRLDVWEGLQNGECDFLLASVTGWNQLKAKRAYNPNCDLFWVGGDRIVLEQSAGFALKADSGYLCTGFIRDVLNAHMHEMHVSGFFSDAWDKENTIAQDIDCNNHRPELSFIPAQDVSPDGEGGQRNLLKSTRQGNDKETDVRRRRSRILKAAGKGATGGAVAISSSAANGQDERRLTVEQMIGTFVFHWGLMVTAVLIASSNALYLKYGKQKGNSIAGAQRVGLEATQVGLPSTGDATLTTDDENNKREVDEILELRQQVASMQLHLQQSEQNRQRFEERVLVELVRLQEQAANPAEVHGGEVITQQQVPSYGRGSSLICGDIHSFKFNSSEGD